MTDQPKKEILVAVSGGFDPVHVGHLRMFQAAKELGDKLIVFLNSDEFLTIKKGKPFMDWEDRREIIKGFECVDYVVPVIDQDQTVCETLREYNPDIFANGGDRVKGNVPEDVVCAEQGILMYYNVGGGKIRSSSELVENFLDK